MWHENARALRIATGITGGLTGAMLGSFVGLSFVAPRPCQDNPGCSPPANDGLREGYIGLGVALGLSALGFVIAGAMYDRHLDRGVLYRPRPESAPLTGLRADPRWFARDRRLTTGMRVTAAFAGLGGTALGCWLGLGDGGGLIGAALGLTAFSGLNIVALAILAKVRQKHRRRLEAWPPLGAGGLTIQF